MKNLIYFTLGNKKEYFHLLYLCLSSLIKTGYNSDILIITDLKSELISFYEERGSLPNNIYFLEVDGTDLLSSSANKLQLFKWENIVDYNKIIFSDLDILWLNDTSKIFNLIEEDFFYVSNETGLMSEKWWGGNLLTNEEVKYIELEKILGINAGIFAFNKSMIKHLEFMFNLYVSNIQLLNEALEQPIFNSYLLRNKLYDCSLNNLVSNMGYYVDKYNGVALHFPGTPGNFQTKFDKMLKYFTKNINS